MRIKFVVLMMLIASFCFMPKAFAQSHASDMWTVTAEVGQVDFNVPARIPGTLIIKKKTQGGIWIPSSVILKDTWDNGVTNYSIAEIYGFADHTYGWTLFCTKATSNHNCDFTVRFLNFVLYIAYGITQYEDVTYTLSNLYTHEDTNFPTLICRFELGVL